MDKDYQHENKNFLMAQDLFLKNGDSESWCKMWIIGNKITLRLVNHELTKTRYHMSKEDREEKALDALIYVLRRYRKAYKSGKQYKIKSSPCSAFYFGVKHSLYYQTKADKITEFVEDDILGSLTANQK